MTKKTRTYQKEKLILAEATNNLIIKEIDKCVLVCANSIENFTEEYYNSLRLLTAESFPWRSSCSKIGT